MHPTSMQATGRPTLLRERGTERGAARGGPVSVDAALARGDDDELAVIIKDACSRELMDLGLSFNSLNIKAVLSDVADARRRESAAGAKASADMVQAQEEQRAKIAQLEAAQKINDQERSLKMQITSNGAAIARVEAERQTAVRQQREAELNAAQITQARADSNSQFVNFGSGGAGGQGAVGTGTEDVLRVVQTLMAAQVVNNPVRGDGAEPVARPVNRTSDLVLPKR